MDKTAKEHLSFLLVSLDGGYNAFAMMSIFCFGGDLRAPQSR